MVEVLPMAHQGALQDLLPHPLFTSPAFFWGGVGRVSLVAQTVKNPLAMWETWVRSLGWEDPLEEGMATYSSILAWRVLMDRGTWTPMGSMESQRLRD